MSATRAMPDRHVTAAKAKAAMVLAEAALMGGEGRALPELSVASAKKGGNKIAAVCWEGMNLEKNLLEGQELQNLSEGDSFSHKLPSERPRSKPSAE